MEYTRHGRVKQALATKEVIVSAGTLNSPKLLMLSGIGPREHLQSLNVNYLPSNVQNFKRIMPMRS